MVESTLLIVSNRTWILKIIHWIWVSIPSFLELEHRKDNHTMIMIILYKLRLPLKTSNKVYQTPPHFNLDNDRNYNTSSTFSLSLLKKSLHLGPTHARITYAIGLLRFHSTKKMMDKIRRLIIACLSVALTSQ